MTLLDPSFPHLSLPPSLTAPLPLPSPGGVLPPLVLAPLRGSVGLAVGLLEPSGTGPALHRAAPASPHTDPSALARAPTVSGKGARSPFTRSPMTLTGAKFINPVRGAAWGCRGTAPPFCSSCLQDQSMQ